jgi:hypothetical protein
LPLVALRDETPGFAVSLVKAGARLRGDKVGGVRPPLADPTPDQLRRLEQIIDDGLATLATLSEKDTPETALRSREPAVHIRRPPGNNLPRAPSAW